MAAPGFGFSVGDFIAGVSLVKKLIRSLNDAAGSRAAYRKLISELLNLEDALTEIGKLQLGPAQEPQKLALRRVVRECEASIETFLLKNAKFNDSLGVQPVVTPPTWRTNLHKIQWSLCKDSAVDDLRTEIAAHTTTLNIKLATIQVSATKLHEQRLDNCTQLLQAVCDETKEASARAEQNRETLMVHTGMMETISQAVSRLVFGTQEDGLLSLVRAGLQWHIRIFNAVTQIQQLLCSIPSQIEREQPVLFEDAHGRLSPFHVEFINSYGAFQAVLEARFENVPGLRKVINLEYAMQDTQSKKIIDLSGPWENAIRPGRKFVMSMIFQMSNAMVSACPGCSTETSSRLVNAGSDIQCLNSDCGLVYRCITDVQDSKLCKRKQSHSYSGLAKRRKHRHKDNVTDEDDQDGISEFRRVQIMHSEPSSSAERTPSPDDTTGRCIKNIYYDVYSDGETDILERLNTCRPGHICSDPIVREFDRKVNLTRAEFIDRCLESSGDVGGGYTRTEVSSAGQLGVDNEIVSSPPQSTPLSPGWSPLETYATKNPSVDNPLPPITSDVLEADLPPLPPPRFLPVNGP